VNGWSTQRRCGEPGNDILVQAACARDLTAVNIPAEAVYWTTTVDSTGQPLTGANDYVLHFPAGELPPNDAFWSLTMTDAQKRLVPNALNRYAVGDRSGLVPNPDGSVDVAIQAAAPATDQANWLPAPDADFMLWLRAYQPGEQILDSSYQVPAVALVATGNPPAAGPARLPWFRILLVVVAIIWIPTAIFLVRRRRRRRSPLDQRSWRERHRHLITVGAVALPVWIVGMVVFIDIYPSLIYAAWRNGIVAHGVDAGSSGGIPVNTLYAVPDLASPSASNAPVLTTGTNADTLYVGGWLDLTHAAQVLHVPDMAGRYYTVQLVDPSTGTDFAYVGRRTTGTDAGDYVISGPGWSGTVPAGATQIASPNDSVFVVGRVLVENADDIATAYDLSKQIQVAPLGP
jgi:hypothetical protein